MKHWSVIIATMGPTKQNQYLGLFGTAIRIQSLMGWRLYSQPECRSLIFVEARAGCFSSDLGLDPFWSFRVSCCQELIEWARLAHVVSHPKQKIREVFSYSICWEFLILCHRYCENSFLFCQCNSMEVDFKCLSCLKLLYSHLLVCLRVWFWRLLCLARVGVIVDP